MIKTTKINKFEKFGKTIMMNNRKAQIETIGLAIIIILIVTIGLIALFLSANKPKQELLDQNTINLATAILRTKTSQAIEMKELIANSNQDNDFEDLNRELNLILSKQTINYGIKIRADSEEVFSLNPCLGITEIKIFTKNSIKYEFVLIKCDSELNI